MAKPHVKDIEDINQLTGCSTAELVEIYNELTGEKVVRFASRDAGLKRIAKVLRARVATPAPAPAPKKVPAPAPSSYPRPRFPKVWGQSAVVVIRSLAKAGVARDRVQKFLESRGVVVAKGTLNINWLSGSKGLHKQIEITSEMLKEVA